MGAFHALKIVQMVPNVQILQQRQQTLQAAIHLLTEALNNVWNLFKIINKDARSRRQPDLSHILLVFQFSLWTSKYRPVG